MKYNTLSEHSLKLSIPGDAEMLKSRLFDVNLRLYKKNRKYRKIVKSVLKHMRKIVKRGFKDYPEVLGISGANVGVPFNIIVVKSLPSKKILEMINPEIHYFEEGGYRDVRSNCGALQLADKILIQRYNEISVSYYDKKGHHNLIFCKGQLASTVQHEVDHNNGILITDRAKERDNEKTRSTRDAPRRSIPCRYTVRGR